MANLLCIYGDTGDGKTSLLGSLILYMMKKHPGQKARLYTADNYDVLEPYIDAGILDVWQLPLWDFPFEALDYASQGYWPEDPNKPNSRLLKPDSKVWNAYKLFLYEGISHFSDMLMKRLADIGGEGKTIGPGTRVDLKGGEKADLINFMDGSYGVGGNAQSHYNIVQKEMRKNILVTSVLPVQTVWTAHTCKAAEDGKAIFGPMLIGNKATAKIQSWFSSMLHAYSVDIKGKLSYRLYLKEHIDPEVGKIPFKAISRIPLQLLDPSLKQTIENKWNEIVPDYLEWTNDSAVMEKFMEIRSRMRLAAKQLILEATNV